MGVPGADDVMLNYQSTSFHDALVLREVLGLRPAPEFEAWLERMGIADSARPALAAEPAARLARRRGRRPDGEVPREPDAVRPDPWTELRRHTPARIALGSSGNSLPTDELLRFGVAHAQARDAVHLPLDAQALRRELLAHGSTTCSARKRRPGPRHLSAAARSGPAALGDAVVQALSAGPAAGCDLLCVIGDGLSATAVQRHAAAAADATASRAWTAPGCGWGRW